MSVKTKVLALALLAPLALASSATSWAQAVPQQYQPVPYNWQPPAPNQNRPSMSASPGASMGAPGWNQQPAPQPTPRPPLWQQPIQDPTGIGKSQGPSPGDFVGPHGVHPPGAWDVYNYGATGAYDRAMPASPCGPGLTYYNGYCYRR
jgi:hypothetical protein